MASQKVSFQSLDGISLVGIISVPDGKPPFPVIVICHGYSSSKDSESYTTLEKLLIPSGVAVFRFDYRAHGESEGSWEDLTLGGVKADIKSAIDHLLENFQEKINKKKLILYGGSFSGLPVVWLTSEDERIKYLICRSGVIDPFKRYKRLYDINKWRNQGWIGSIYGNKDPRYTKLSYELINEIADLKIEKVASRVKVPTLIMHGTADKVVLPDHSHFLYRKLGSKKKTLKLIEGVNHWYHGKRDEMQKTIVDWIKKKVLK
jgi:dipeptidyl aminopeptidase/acylaminoacyl peptidase